ncbi:hypothetical protein [Flavobacterium psychrotrophum]|uniref:hypothetical protein n=1 Tax=Flavobacterium psychrotrophum TaxID=2294119 RepID=UPI0013C42F3F|nr:hypothetical protein [Flavobacterium psychrotrophum]
MKNIFLKAICLAAVLTVMTSCDSDSVFYHGDQSLVGFNKTEARLPVYAAEDNKSNVLYVEVGATAVADHDRTFKIEVDEASTTALPSYYTIDQSTLFIPAGEYIGKIKITGNYDAIPELVRNTITLNLIEVQDADTYNDDKMQCVVSIYQGCIKPIADKYSISVYDPTSVPAFDAVLKPVADVDNTYSIGNLWGDFVAAATGQASLAGQYPWPAEIEIRCDNSVIVLCTDSGTRPVGTSGTGTYDEGTKSINVTIDEHVFTNPMMVSIDLIAK